MSEVAEQNVTLQPGESKVIGFETVPNEAKTYQVSVNGLTGSFVATSPIPQKPDYLNGALAGDILYFSGDGAWYWSTTRNWYYNTRSLAQFPIKNTGSLRCPVGIDFMGIHEGIWLDPGQTVNWEIAVLALEGTNTYPYQIWVQDPETGIEYVVEEGSLTITGIYL